MTIYTIGHSTLRIGDYLRVLASAPEPISTVIDIRSHPVSKWPWFHKAEMERWLPDCEYKYEWWPALGGWTKRTAANCCKHEFVARGVDVNAYEQGKFPKHRIGMVRKEHDDRPSWTNQGLYDYSWFMTLSEFLNAGRVLIARGKMDNVAIMCAENLWWKCHRSMVSDWLVYTGSDAVHLQPKLTKHSDVLGNRIERYHSDIRLVWEDCIAAHAVL